MNKNRPAPHEESVVLSAATAKTVTVKGPQNTGLLRVIYLALAYDEAQTAGGAEQDVLVKIRGQYQTDIMGGDIYHSFYGQPNFNGSARNTIALGFSLPPGEDLELEFLSDDGATIRFNVQRWLVFSEQAGAGFPELKTAGGLRVL